jgi:thioredoxin 1
LPAFDEYTAKEAERYLKIMMKNDPQTQLILKAVVLVAVVLLIAGAFVLKRSNTAGGGMAATAGMASPRAPGTAAAYTVSHPLHVTSPLDLAALRSSGLPVIIDYGADSCIPCKEMAPVLEELNRDLAGKAIILFVDVWKYRNLAAGVPIQVIPTQVFFDAQGKPFTPPEDLAIQFNSYSMRDTNEHVFTTHEGGLDKSQLLAILTAMGMN